MKTRADNKSTKTKRCNYNLPKGFVLDYDIISHDAPLDKSQHKPKIQTIRHDFNKYINERHLDVDYRILAKELIDLPEIPSRYHLSFIVFKVLRKEELDDLILAYPNRYLPPIEKGTAEQRLDAFKIHETLVKSPQWKGQIERCVKRYFNKNTYKKPIPILIKYGRCGCYSKSILDVEYDKKFHRCFFQHNPWFDGDYHRVFANSPIRLGADLKMTDFLIEIVTKVNEYAQRQLLSIEEICDMWQYFVTVNLDLRENGYVNPEFIKKYFNPKIEAFGSKPRSPEEYFYLVNYAHFAQELEYRKILKRCQRCHSACSYREDKVYCGPECRKSASGKRNYWKNVWKKRRISMLEMRETRRINKEAAAKEKMLKQQAILARPPDKNHS